MKSEWQNFAALEDHIWARLGQAVATAADPWRYVTLATMDQEGPQARLVGLRAADRTSRNVEVHTDTRTPKVAQLRADPRGQFLFWDPTRQEQLRLSVHIEIVVGDETRWARIPGGARGNYGTDPVPGAPIPESDQYERRPDPNRHCALLGRVVAMDILTLASVPHRRAVWQDAAWRWVAP